MKSSRALRFCRGCSGCRLGIGPVAAQETYKIGSAARAERLCGGNDRAWRDGQILAVEALNAKGGLLRQKIEYMSRTTARSRRKRWSATAR